MLTVRDRNLDTMRSLLTDWFEQCKGGKLSGVNAICQLFEWDLFHTVTSDVLDRLGCEGTIRDIIRYICDSAFGVHRTRLAIDIHLVPPSLMSWYQAGQLSIDNIEFSNTLSADRTWHGRIESIITFRRYLMGELEMTDRLLLETIELSTPGMVRLLVASIARIRVLNMPPRQAGIVARALLRLSASMLSLSTMWGEFTASERMSSADNDDSVLNVSKVSTSLMVIESIMNGVEPKSLVQASELSLLKTSVDMLVESVYSPSS